MATLQMLGFYGHTSNQEHYFTSASPIGFGMDATAWPDNILKDATARYACICSGDGSAAQKSAGINCMSFGEEKASDYDTYCFTVGRSGTAEIYEDGTWIVGSGFSQGSPHPYNCMRVYFSHGSQVNATPALVWISSVSAGTVYYHFASVWLMEADTSWSQKWQHSTPGDKMHFGAHTHVATAHNYYMGLSIAPRSDAVGFNSDGYIQFSITYS